MAVAAFHKESLTAPSPQDSPPLRYPVKTLADLVGYLPESSLQALIGKIQRDRP